MKHTRISPSTAVLAAGIGLVSGMRSMAAPAILARQLSGARRRRHTGAAVRWLRHPVAARWLPVMAAGEMAADKAPFVPDRTEPPSLAGRAASGGICGAAVAGWHSESEIAGALIGAVAALASTFGVYHLRAAAGRALPVPDAVVGAAEDAAAVALGSRVASHLS